MPAAASVVFMDPAGDRFGIPTWSWGMAPAHLLTRAQLRERGLCPGGQPVAGQILWRSRQAARNGWIRAAFLYDVRRAKPRRPATPAQLEALAKALAARRTCPRCRRDVGYVLPQRIGACLTCADRWEIDRA
ncbi:RRQRL motif-containing zinc-binding protein [Actinomadura formosensis]|uniref:RRQRL motif-containing zinc-binding protein n=1 Tax=Actinomadura formosensis TaxID=60706 RepID=UPI00083353D9|nr:RRQRL motif-containing zinc-binding protein [Actinomadura formosensis]